MGEPSEGDAGPSEQLPPPEPAVPVGPPSVGWPPAPQATPPPADSSWQYSPPAQYPASGAQPVPPSGSQPAAGYSPGPPPGGFVPPSQQTGGYAFQPASFQSVSYETVSYQSGTFPQQTGAYPTAGPPPGWTPPGRRRARSRLVLILLSVVLVVAVGVTAFVLLTNAGDETAAPRPPSAASLIKAATDRLATLDGAHYTGSYFDDARGTVRVDVTATKDGDVTGTITVYGTTADLMLSGDGVFIRGGEAFWNSVMPTYTRAYVEKWIRAPNDVIDPDLGDALQPAEFAKIATCERDEGGKFTVGQDAVRIDGVDSYRLESEGCGVVYVGVEEPRRVVRVQGASLDGSATESGDRFTGFSFGVREVEKSELADIGTAVDDAADQADQGPNAEDPSSLPPYYMVTALDAPSEQCAESGCLVTVTVQNVFGPGDPSTATVELRADSATGPVLGTCTAPVPALAHQQTASISCTVVGDEWTAWVLSIPPGGAAYYSSAGIDNPAWGRTVASDAALLAVVDEQTALDVEATYGPVGLEILSMATAAGALPADHVLTLLQDASAFGGLQAVRDLLVSAKVPNVANLLAAVSAAAADFPDSTSGAQAIAAGAALALEGHGPLDFADNVVIDDSAQDAMAFVSQLNPTGEEFVDSVGSTLSGLDSWAGNGYTPVAVMVIEPYLTELYGLAEEKPVLHQLEKLGVTKKQLGADGGELEIRTGGGSFRFTAGDFE